MNFWDRRANMDNKPTLQNRTIVVIDHIRKKLNVSVGVAIEKLILGEINFQDMLDELRKEKMSGL